MKLPRASRRRTADSVTPLINVVFLLLIFFMLTGTISRPDLLDVRPPAAAAGSDEAADGLRIQLDANGQLAIDRRRLTIRQVTAEVARRQKADPGSRVVIAADGQTEAGKVLNLLDALRDAGVARVSIATVRRRQQ